MAWDRPARGALDIWRPENGNIWLDAFSRNAAKTAQKVIIIGGNLRQTEGDLRGAACDAHTFTVYYLPQPPSSYAAVFATRFPSSFLPSISSGSSGNGGAAAGGAEAAAAAAVGMRARRMARRGDGRQGSGWSSRARMVQEGR